MLLPRSLCCLDQCVQQHTDSISKVRTGLCVLSLNQNPLIDFLKDQVTKELHQELLLLWDR